MNDKFPNDGSTVTKEYRVPMTLEEFEQIGLTESELGYEYYERFYVANERLNRASSKEIRNHATKGLKLLVWSSFFDGEVCNGGIAQFFWNCPDLVADVCEVFDEFDLNELHKAYEVACDTVMENIDEWLLLRDEAYQDETNPSWLSYRNACDLLDLSWFDEKYWEKYSWSEDGGTRVVSPGLRTELFAKLAAYVRGNPMEFIVFPETGCG